VHQRILLALFVIVAAAAAPAVGRAASLWVEQGPGPIFNGGVSGLPDDPAAGAVNAIVADPADAGQLLIGTVNGGVWATFDATGPKALWTPETDRLPALSIGSLAASPVNFRHVFAGTGSTSSFGGEGSPGFGILRSKDGGLTWEVLGQSAFARQVVDAVVPTRLSGGAVVLAATRRFPAEQEVDEEESQADAEVAAQAAPTRGVFRSVNATATDPKKVVFTAVSDKAGSGLPAGGVSALIADPSNRNRFYASLSFFDGARGKAGVYRSNDGGATWKQVNGSGGKTLVGVADSVRILLSVHASQNSNVVYAAVIRAVKNQLDVPVGGVLGGVFRSVDQGVSWTSFGVSRPPIFPGRQGDLHGALAADPFNPNVAFIAGDSQAQPFPNANGCRDFVANVFRLDISQPAAMRWQNVVCDGANGTAPHADARAMAFDANGDLLLANDGGVYRLVDPNLPNFRQWQPVIGNLRPTEFHSVAYDPISKVVIGGTQDNGTVVQSSPGSFAWNELQGGDGGVVAIDADQNRHPGTTLRYTSAQDFGGFMRTTWDAANNVLDQRFLRLFVTAGRGVCVGRTLFACDEDTDEIQFYNPYVLNTINPRRMLIGTNALYESFDQGDTLGALTRNTPARIVGLAYGGRHGGRNFAGIIYAGNGNVILHRVDSGGAIVTLAYPGSTVRGLAINPFDYTQIAVLDDRNRVWLSANEGKPRSWRNLTGNLGSLTSQVQSIAFCSLDATLAKSVLVAGGFGVFELRSPGSGGKWAALGSGFPHALFLDLHYDQANDLLLAGSLGRGAWTLPGFLKGGAAPAAVAANAAALPTAPPPYNLSVPLFPPAAAAAHTQSLPWR
jgi:hypothetical protein